jgi:hypothetical protein
MKEHPVPPLSHEELVSRVRDCLEQIEDSNDPYGPFCEAWNDIDTGNKKNTYRIYFPLRVQKPAEEYTISGISPEDEQSVKSTKIKRIDHRVWQEQVDSLPGGTTSGDNYRAEISRLKEDSDQSVLSEYENVFWKTEIQEHRKVDAYLRLKRSLEFFLGVVYKEYWRDDPVSLESDEIYALTDRRPLTVPYPPCILMFENNVPQDPITNRTPFTDSQVDLSEIDDIETHLGPVRADSMLYERYVRAVSSVYHAMSGRTPSHMFHGYWRALERLTLTESGDTSRDVLKRVNVAIDNGTDGFPGTASVHLQNKRNNFVHETAGPRITEQQINLVKSLVEELMELYIELFEGRRPTLTKAELKTVFDTSTKDQTDLANTIESHLQGFNDGGKSSSSGRERLEKVSRLLSVYEWRSIHE